MVLSWSSAADQGVKNSSPVAEENLRKEETEKRYDSGMLCSTKMQHMKMVLAKAAWRSLGDLLDMLAMS